jgi:hypothetical protein
MSRALKAYLVDRGLNPEYVRAPRYWVKGEPGD